MVALYGAAGLSQRRQAYVLLERAVCLCWGWERLPEVERAARGKPWFPQFSRHHFNLSHSGSWALCVLSDHPVGVDIQEIRPAWSPKLVERTCTPAERAWLSACGNRPEDFAALWACKESVGKRSGYGLPYPPSRLEIPLPEGGGALSAGQTFELDGALLRGYAGDGWRGAVCAGEAPPQEIIWLPLAE